MRQRRWIETLNDYNCELRYHPGKANVVADALSWKERTVPLRVRALNITIHSNLHSQIRVAQEEALKEENISREYLNILVSKFVVRESGLRCYAARIWVPRYGDLRSLLLDEAHKSRYSIHPGAGKMLGTNNSGTV
ncbi:uncharacterized protein [Rutidosis leptorrhynchoides]|uniref:uncharacterized protein n=1 Tax=Rutidosis leptorrhynchoides TaxID=125765 RepID=UPI003A9954A7